MGKFTVTLLKEEHDKITKRCPCAVKFSFRIDYHFHIQGNCLNVQIRMGERLTDDIIDAYCDKLQESVNKEVDGMLAMQYILVGSRLLSKTDHLHHFIRLMKQSLTTLSISLL